MISGDLDGIDIEPPLILLSWNNLDIESYCLELISFTKWEKSLYWIQIYV